MKLFVVLFFVVVHICTAKPFTNETQYCQACHASTKSWLQGKRLTLRSWIKEDEPKTMGHHWWFKKETFTTLAKLRCAHQGANGHSFYEQLKIVGERLQERPSEEPLRQWDELMKQGKKEVPGFRKIWQRGLKLRNLKLNELKDECEAALLAIREPYTKLHLKKGSVFNYHSSHRMHVGRILFFFGGMREKSLSQTLFKVKDYKNKNYSMTTSYGARARPAPLHAAFTIDRAGTLLSIDGYVPYEDYRLKNLADFFSRGGGTEFGTFTFDKIVHLKKRSRMTRSSVAVKVTIKVEGMKIVEDEPCLIGTFTIRERPDGHRDRFTLWGKGKFVHLPNGLVACQETNMKFRVKILGIPFVKGSVVGRSWLAPDGREGGPYRPTTFGWTKED